MIHLSRDDRGRLGSFDPGCFTVDFRTATDGTAPGTDARVLLGRVPDPLLAHEFAHFLHATGTRAGIYNYAHSVDYALGLSALTVLRQLAHARNGRTVDEQTSQTSGGPSRLPCRRCSSPPAASLRTAAPHRSAGWRSSNG